MSDLTPDPSDSTGVQRSESLLGPEAMAPAPVSLHFARPGLAAPVYVVTSMSEPPWNPVEMDCVQGDDGELKFYKVFDAEDGHHQYKFRLGPGDWWTLDETKPIVDDGDGNRNNLIVVKHDGSLEDSVLSSSEMITAQDSSSNFKSVNDEPSMVDSAYKTQNDDYDEHTPPLFSHESFTEYDTEDASEGGEFEDEMSFSSRNSSDTLPDAVDDNGTPLFRHESMCMDASINAESPKVKELLQFDNSDAAIEQFPTSHADIIRHLARVSSRLPEDEVIVQGTPPSSPVNTDQSRQRSLSLRTNLTSDSSSQLEPIREAEEDWSTHQEPGSGHKRMHSTTSPDDILTPPMTPDLANQEHVIEQLPALSGSVIVDDQSHDVDEDKQTSPSTPRGLYPRLKGLVQSTRKHVIDVAGSTAKASGIFAVFVGLAAIVYRWQAARAAMATKSLRLLYPYAHNIDPQQTHSNTEQRREASDIISG